MLDGRADAAEQDEGTQHRVALGRRQQREGDAREHGAGGQQRALADPLGQHAGRQLQAGHGGGIGHAQRADLHVAEAERLRPDGQQHVEGVGNAVVHEVRRAAYGEACDARRARLRRALSRCSLTLKRLPSAVAAAPLRVGADDRLSDTE